MSTSKKIDRQKAPVGLYANKDAQALGQDLGSLLVQTIHKRLTTHLAKGTPLSMELVKVAIMATRDLGLGSVDISGTSRKAKARAKEIETIKALLIQGLLAELRQPRPSTQALLLARTILQDAGVSIQLLEATQEGTKVAAKVTKAAPLRAVKLPFGPDSSA